MATANPSVITLDMMRESLYAAVVCDVLDAAGYPHQSPRVQLKPLTGSGVLVGRCKTTLWADMAHPDPQPYELELAAVVKSSPQMPERVEPPAAAIRTSLGLQLSTAANSSSYGFGSACAMSAHSVVLQRPTSVCAFVIGVSWTRGD